MYIELNITKNQIFVYYGPFILQKPCKVMDLLGINTNYSLIRAAFGRFIIIVN